MKRMAILLMAAMMMVSACAAAQPLCVDFFDVGKADAMLITTPAGERVLIDAATNKEGEKLAKRFLKAGIDRIDAMIITHFDKDHVGGADKMLEALSIGTVIAPVYDKESKQHTQFLEALDECPPDEMLYMKTGERVTYTLKSGLSLHITAAHEVFYGSDEENDFSLAVRMTYGETRFFFAGDAEDARQMELLEEGDVACDVLKVPYHGRTVKNSPAFLSEAAPKIAFITDDKDDPAEPALVQILERLGTDVFCAREDGDVTVFSDGVNVWAE